MGLGDWIRSFFAKRNNPALEELYFFGNHPGNFAFEIGNPDLPSERGLGLDISRRIVVERHGGEISLESRDGGAVAVVRLPLRPAEG